MKSAAKKKNKTVVLLVVPPHSKAPGQSPRSITLDSANHFAVLAGATVDNTGKTAVRGGDVGTSHGPEITGFPPGTVAAPHTKRTADAVALQAHTDLTTAYNAAEAMPPTHDLSGQDLGGLTLLPGVYRFSAGATLNGTLTLKDQDDPDAQFIFQIGTTLTTSGGSSIISIDGTAHSWVKSNVLWQVGGSATLGADSAFAGNILARGDITFRKDAMIRHGSVLSQFGNVTLDSNRVSKSDHPGR